MSSIRDETPIRGFSTEIWKYSSNAFSDRSTSPLPKRHEIFDVRILHGTQQTRRRCVLTINYTICTVVAKHTRLEHVQGCDANAFTSVVNLVGTWFLELPDISRAGV
jgi:hypothetical protein